MGKDTCDLIELYSDVETTHVKWVWFPYIPSGKITILQGDPGDGKSLLMSKIIADITRGYSLPGDDASLLQANIIYQCSEDSLTDTIKPRLECAGADCSKVAFINESECSLTLDDERLRIAIQQFGASLVVIDPVQAYLGDAEISNAKSIRRIMRRLALWAEAYDCAIVLVGHLNKNERSKDLYRSLGSIDIMAAARSVLQIEHGEEQGERSIVQLKNSIAPFGKQIGFRIESDGRITWEASARDEFVQREQLPSKEQAESKSDRAAIIIKIALSAGCRQASEVFDLCEQNDICPKTVKRVKHDMGIETFKKGKQWYWRLPNTEDGDGS